MSAEELKADKFDPNFTALLSLLRHYLSPELSMAVIKEYARIMSL